MSFAILSQMSAEWMKLSTTGMRRYQLQSLLLSTKKLVKFGLLTTKLTRLMFTHPRLNSARAVYGLMQLHSSGGVNCGLSAPKYRLSSRTYGAGRPRVRLCLKFLVWYCFIHARLSRRVLYLRQLVSQTSLDNSVSLVTDVMAVMAVSRCAVVATSAAIIII